MCKKCSSEQVTILLHSHLPDNTLCEQSKDFTMKICSSPVIPPYGTFGRSYLRPFQRAPAGEYAQRAELMAMITAIIAERG